MPDAPKPTRTSNELSLEVLKILGVDTDMPIVHASIFLSFRHPPRINVTYEHLLTSEKGLPTLKRTAKKFILKEL